MIGYLGMASRLFDRPAAEDQDNFRNYFCVKLMDELGLVWAADTLDVEFHKQDFFYLTDEELKQIGFKGKNHHA